MKISYMLKREDFYAINENTLRSFYRDSTGEKRLYIYPELNAIVTARPSKAVRKYLYTEYRVNGSVVKRLLVRLYAGVLLNSFGLLAAKSLKIKTDADADTLIYPCNKKYRIFAFDKGRVSVVAKDGFPTGDLVNEIQFRTHNTADFIPGLLISNERGYTERIIDGLPVARAGGRTKELVDRAFSVWSGYVAPHTRDVPAADWAASMRKEAEALLKQAEDMGKAVDGRMLRTLLDELSCVLNDSGEMIPVSLSHGDLQPGNIWVENGTDRLYIIDWESCTRRSLWYDKAVLYEGLRRDDGLHRYAAKRDIAHATVLLEDIVFRLVELCELPCDYGCKEFNTYIQIVLGGNRDV